MAALVEERVAQLKAYFNHGGFGYGRSHFGFAPGHFLMVDPVAQDLLQAGP